MFNVGNNIVYKKDVCKIIEIKENYINENDYYVLKPLFNDSLKIEIPVTNPNIRDLITKKEVNDIINKIPEIELIDAEDRMIEYEYKNLMNTNNHEDLIKIIKTTYLRNKKRVDNNKKLGGKDSDYFNQAEKYLYQEFSVVLGMTYDETKKYVIEKVNKI
jgi:CarD family transcriptional regulator